MHNLLRFLILSPLRPLLFALHFVLELIADPALLLLEIGDVLVVDFVPGPQLPVEVLLGVLAVAGVVLQKLGPAYLHHVLQRVEQQLGLPRKHQFLLLGSGYLRLRGLFLLDSYLVDLQRAEEGGLGLRVAVLAGHAALNEAVDLHPREGVDLPVF